MKYLLETRNLSVQYGEIVALKGLSLQVGPGEAVALVGANGAGKTTLIKSIIGLLKLSGGELLFDGHDVRAVPAYHRARRGIGYSPEGRRVFPGLSVRENLEVASFATGQETCRLIDRMYAIFPALKQKERALGWTLSGGQQQMLAVCRALMSQPRLLLLDEPSLGLSPKLTDEVLWRIPEIAKSGTAVVLAEQNLTEALEVTSRAYVLRVGSIVLEGPSQELRSNPSVRNSFLGGL
ncbi:ABC transporter ATP-binding protein [Bradyrhizobium sp. Arg237L]|uniref:ABC transporter ATP-binding protein n=1 Tax=Bradyrhizobium sp. Arg237L TaxID=3003352 RepID=UPI00249F0405|nr:ABC transporter ATP-binding protein [Bradyrhizobium sp. Arg237L]MDI4237131.1 ABC transporter ATP-binding protein [Bradyrhizobium sp. Arg237L]